MPLAFVENRGQTDKRVAYYAAGPGQSIYFSNNGLTFSFASPRWTVKLDFVGANPSVRPVAEDVTPAVVSHFKGAKNSWRTGLKTYRTIVYRNLWPGIDAVYTGHADALKYTFTVHPGANPALIKLRYRGVSGLRLSDAGGLEISTPARNFTDAHPVSYQENAPVATAYSLQSNTYGFRVGAYDTRRTLLIDPLLPVFCGFLGGTGDDTGFATAGDHERFRVGLHRPTQIYGTECHKSIETSRSEAGRRRSTGRGCAWWRCGCSRRRASTA